MNGEARWLSRSERLQRLLLRLYPSDFRRDMGPSMVEAFRDACRAAYRSSGPRGVLWQWLRSSASALWHAAAERAGTWRGQEGGGGAWIHDLRLVVRRLAASPGYAVVTVLSIALGIGAFGSVFAAVDSVLLERPSYESPDDLYYVWRDYTWIGFPRGWLGGPDVEALASAGDPILGATPLRMSRAALSRTGERPQEIRLMVVGANFFELLGRQPGLGRGFGADEEGEGRPNVIVLGDDLWRTTFGADAGIVGQEILLDGERYSVVGVTERGFRFARHSSLGPPETADAYVTFDYAVGEQNPGSGAFAGLVRAREGASSERVAAAVDRVGRMLDERDHQSRGLRLYPEGLHEDLVRDVRPALTVLGLAGAFLLLVLGLNVATLQVSRAAQRERETAVCKALGAGGGRLARSALLDGGLAGLAGGVLGACAAVFGSSVLVDLAPSNLPRREEIGVDAAGFVLLCLAGLAIGFASGTVPAAWAARTPVGRVLRAGGVRAGTGGRGRVRRALVVAQVALSLVLLAAGGLLVRSFERVLAADPGFEPTGLLTFRVPLSDAAYAEDEDVDAVQTRLRRALAALPAVRGAGGVSALPLTGETDQSGVTFPGAPGNTGVREQDAPLVDVFGTTPGYLEALQVRVIEGRLFQETDGDRALAVIDRGLAERFFPRGGAVGAPLRVDGGDTAVVVGVVQQPRLYERHADGRWQVYLSNAWYTYSDLSYVVRSDQDPATLLPAAHDVVDAVDPALPVAEVRTMDDILDDSLSEQKLSATLVAAAAFGALLLAGLGLFGVVSNIVTRRTHEMGVRIALGARSSQVAGLVLGEGLGLALTGLVLGLPGVFVAGRLLESMLVGVSPWEPRTLASAATLLGAVVFVACALPARRLARIEPGRALRAD